MKMMILIRYLFIRHAYREKCNTDYDYNENVFVFNSIYFKLSSNLKLSIDIFIMCDLYTVSIDFILGKSWWFEKAKLIKHKLWSVCRWPLGCYFKKEKIYSMNKKMLQTFF